MIIKPVQLGQGSLERTEMLQDRKSCKRFGPCGVGKKALYLNSFYLDCRYYLPLADVTRVYKRVAMSKGGFSQKGVFASIPYLVVEYDGGKEKQCNFKHEEQVDQMLACIGAEHPEIKTLSAKVEKRLEEKARERALKKAPELSGQAESTLKSLRAAKEYLEKRPELSTELSQAAQRKRSFLRSNPSYRWVALAVTLMGVAALAYGVWSLLTRQGSFGIYFALFGLAAVFIFSGASVLPTGRNNKRAIFGRVEKAQTAMKNYLDGYGGEYPVPARYGHPIVLERMCRAVEEGRASRAEEALEVVKKDLQALNSSVKVDQTEYDEVVTIKPMFLNEDYR